MAPAVDRQRVQWTVLPSAVNEAVPSSSSVLNSPSKGSNSSHLSIAFLRATYKSLLGTPVMAEFLRLAEVPRLDVITIDCPSVPIKFGEKSEFLRELKFCAVRTT